MIRDYKEFMERFQYIKEAMKDLGIETIDLNDQGAGMTKATLNDAQICNILQEEIAPEYGDQEVIFHVDGWARLVLIDLGGAVKREMTLMLGKEIMQRETP